MYIDKIKKKINITNGDSFESPFAIMPSFVWTLTLFITPALTWGFVLETLLVVIVGVVIDLIYNIPWSEALEAPELLTPSFPPTRISGK